MFEIGNNVKRTLQYTRFLPEDPWLMRDSSDQANRYDFQAVRHADMQM